MFLTKNIKQKYKNKKKTKKKSHTYEEGGAHFRISFWHLLMNLKKNYLLKNCWNEPIKNKIILLFTMMHFLLKKERKTPVDIIILHLCTKSLNDKIYSSWDIECDRLKLVPFYYLKNPKYKNSEIMKQEWDTKFFVIFDLFLPFYIWSRKTKVWDNEKNIWRYHHFTRVHHRLWSHDVQFLWYSARMTDGQIDGQTGGKSDI